MADTDVVVRGTVLPLTEKARAQFAQDQIDLIAASVVPPGTPLATLDRFLELAARYELDPFANEIWCANMSGRDGGGGRVAILVGRDGYLKVARRESDFIDVDADVVYEKDEFKVTRKADGTRSIEHSYGNPATRGEAIGAYAVLRRKDKPDRYFYAPLDQYQKNPEKSAWKYRDSMLIKCASSYILRTTYGINGPTPADEVGAGLAIEGTNAVIDGSASETVLPENLQALWDRVSEVDAHAFRLNEIEARIPLDLGDERDEAIASIASELEAWLEANEPEDATVVEDDEEEGNGHSLEETEGMVIRDDSIDEETATALQKRWESGKPADRKWREKAEALFMRREELNTLADEHKADVEFPAELDAEIDQVDAEIEKLAIPRFWRPAAVEA